MQFRSIVIGLSLLTRACVPDAPARTAEDPGSEYRATVAEIRPRAAVEFSCAPEALEFVLLSRDGSMPSEIGVRGCGKNGVYARHAGRGASYVKGSWTLAAVRDEERAVTQAELAEIELEQPYQ